MQRMPGACDVEAGLVLCINHDSQLGFISGPATDFLRDF